jgi:adenylate cyclase
MNLRDLAGELRRRHVVRVLAVYAVVAWIVIQVAATVAPALLLPEWTLRLVIALLLLGTPVVGVLAWMFDMTPGGITRTPAHPVPGAPAARQARPLPRLLVGALAVGAVGLGVYRWNAVEPGPDVSEAMPRAIAVLPFANLSAAQDNEYFSDGITEDILTRLSDVPGLRVTSRTSAMGYKGTTRNLRQIGEELGVAYLLEGSVRRVEDRVRITAQLIDARSDAHLWSESYDRDLDDIFAIQSEIATAIAGALELRLSDGDRTRLGRRATDNVAAYDLYLRGRDQFNRRFRNHAERRAILDTAMRLFHDALREDPAFALAHAAIARAWLDAPVRELGRLAIRDSVLLHAGRALEGEPKLAEAHVYTGRAYALTGQIEMANAAFERALQLGPDNPEVLAAYARYAQLANRYDEAVIHFTRAVSLDPSVADYYEAGAAWYFLGDFDRSEEWAWRRHERFPDASRLRSLLGNIAIVRGDLDAASEHYRIALAADPEDSFVLLGAARLEIVRGDFAAALAHLERRALLYPDDSEGSLGFHALALLETGDSARAMELVRQREAGLRQAYEDCRGTCNVHLLAQVAGLEGRGDEAIALLERAVANGWRGIHGMNFRAGRIHGVEDDPRFEQLIARVEADLAAQRARLEREGF